jgi:hypothetical protein
VFSKLNDSLDSFGNGFKRALLSCWVATIPAVLDLRTAELTALQLSRLFAAILQGGIRLTSIHIKLVSLPDGYHAPCEVSGGALEDLVTYGKSCVERCIAGQKRGRNLNKLNDTFDRLRSTKTDGRVKYTSDRIAECGQLLSILAGALPQMCTLQHVGLHFVQLHAQLIPALGQVLMSLPPSVTALTLSTVEFVRDNGSGPLQRSMLFNAIGTLRSLRTLRIPNWEDIVGNDGACVEPLCHLPHLRAVHVRAVKQSSAFPAKLPFKAGPQA